MEINLTSDTVTKPSQEMLAAMMRAEVGDDVFSQDPTVITLQNTVANLFGKEAALFFPSGTMANQAAIKLHTQPGEQLICDHLSHVYLFESGGAAFHSGVTCGTVVGNRGMITAEQVLGRINDPKAFYEPKSALVCIENTTNKGGGACYDVDELLKIKQVCINNNLKLHLDGARLWNALVAKKQHPKTFGDIFDTISVCFSKGLGAPVGSMLIGDAETIQRAIRVRKLMGGGMRQVGYLAAGALYAIQHNVSRLAHDHERAKELGACLAALDWVEKVEEIETNIVIFSTKPQVDYLHVIEALKQQGIYISALGANTLRMVTHLDYTAEMHQIVLLKLQQLF
ncbi:threonine aldolase [Flavobacterium agricola]|uniref:Threonine aldolase n=1 Tax=Flavobacterium agricola TaxID=2870839 RepID=A0ABY6M2B9_9FLAO|nr:GntG family PLP-dependent aldolase [Flavobacterium agricola]UYW01932.1 threonine aldolase [Flavobacterium agricola]